MTANTRVPPFVPAGYGVTVNLAVTQISGNVQYQGLFGQTKANTVRLYNAGPSLVFVEFVGGQGVATASTASGMPLAAGQMEKFTSSSTFVAAVCATGQTATLYITPGEGH